METKERVLNKIAGKKFAEFLKGELELESEVEVDISPEGLEIMSESEEDQSRLLFFSKGMSKNLKQTVTFRFNENKMIITWPGHKLPFHFQENIEH